VIVPCLPLRFLISGFTAFTSIRVYLICELHFSQIIRQVSCGAVHVVALSEEGLLQAWGNYPCKSFFPSEIIDVASQNPDTSVSVNGSSITFPTTS